MKLKPRITHAPNGVKIWYCRTPDGAMGCGSSPKEAYWSWWRVAKKEAAGWLLI